MVINIATWPTLMRRSHHGGKDCYMADVDEAIKPWL